jgi:PRTRC genetic system protein A
MNSNHQPLTPIHLKTHDELPWPQDKAFYLLSRDGLFLCRTHPFFSSCVPTDRWPGELAGQKPFLKMNYPPLPRPLIERTIGFFDMIGQRHSAEAAVLLVWNRQTEAMELVVPEQVATIGGGAYSAPYPIDVSYEIPTLPAHLMLIGDIHSHVDGPAYASWTDKADEAYRPGLHIVVGRVQNEPPEFHCEVTADGTRFLVKDLSLIIPDYQKRRRDVPQEWIARVRVEHWANSTRRSKLTYSSNAATREAPRDLHAEAASPNGK